MLVNHNDANVQRAPDSQPRLYQHGRVIQEFGTLRLLPIADPSLQPDSLWQNLYGD